MTASGFVLHRVAEATEGLFGVALTEDGALWCTLRLAGAVIRRSEGGDCMRIDLGAPAGSPSLLAAATADSVWLTESAGNRILRVDASGVTWAATLHTADARPYGITGLDDGTAWFTETGADAVGRVDILGRITEFDIGVPEGMPGVIASDGTSLWFSLTNGGALAHLRGGDSRATLSRLPGDGAAADGVCIGPDGAVWCADRGRGAVVRVDRRGDQKEYLLSDPLSRPHFVATDNGSGCWVTLQRGGKLVHVDREGGLVEFVLPRGAGEPHGVVTDSSKGVWVALDSGFLAELPAEVILEAGIE